MEQRSHSRLIAERLNQLSQSAFRAAIDLDRRDQSYLNRHGLAKMRVHAERFLVTRVAAAKPRRDGKQTPWKGHPVFVAQHATATCCRNCICKWHDMGKGQSLREAEIQFLADLIMAWLEQRHQVDPQRWLFSDAALR